MKAVGEEQARRASRAPPVPPTATSCSSSPTATSTPRRSLGTAARRARRPSWPGRPERARLRLGAPVPDVPVGRGRSPLGRHPQPLQRRACPRTSSPPRDRLRRSVRTRPRPTRRAARGHSSTTWRSTAGSSAVAPSGSTPGSCWRSHSRCRVTPPSSDGGQVRGHPRGIRVRRAAARRHRAGRGPLGGPAHGPDQHPRGHGVPQDLVRLRPDARRALSRSSRRSSRSSAWRWHPGTPRPGADRAQPRADRLNGGSGPGTAWCDRAPAPRRSGMAGPAPRSRPRP